MPSGTPSSASEGSSGVAERTATAYAVIIVNYGDPALIAANIGTDVDEDGDALVVVVDNFHSDRSRSLAEALCRERGWLYVASANDGFGAGVNRGVVAASSQGHRSFITMNPDATASASVLRELAGHVSADPNCLVSPYMDSSDGRPHFRGSTVNRRTGMMRSGWSDHDDDAEWKNWLSGACLAFSADAFDRLGGFCEEYFLYWEDVDISWRAAELGIRLEIRPDLLVLHDEGGTQDARSTRTKSPTYYFFNIRNRLLFGRRHLRGRDWGRWVLASPVQSALIWMRGGRRQAFSHPRGLVAAARGLLAGTALVVRRPRRRGAGTRPAGQGRPVLDAARPDAGPIRITVAIPTYRRPDLLRALLDVVPDRIAEAPDAVVDVLVVDNDPDASAQEVISGTHLDLRYVVEDTPGIAAARNRALDECRRSDLIAFIDDDEIPRPRWLSSLLDVRTTHRSSAVMGRVISVFDDTADPWVIATGTFHRPERPTGTRLPVAASGNLLLDVQQVQELGIRFDEALGLSGGEDTLFSRQLVERGGTIVWCNESETEDLVVARRVTREWATQRAFSSANGLVHVSLRLTPSSVQRLVLRARFLLGGTARIAAGLARHRFGRTFRHLEHDARGMRTFHRGRGMLAGARGQLFQEYART